MKSNAINIITSRRFQLFLKQTLFLFCLACPLITSNLHAMISGPTLSQQSFGDYVPDGLVHVIGEIDNITENISAIGIQIILPEGLTYEMQSISDIWLNEKITENGVELVVSKIPTENNIQFHYLLHASPQLKGKQTVHAKMFYRMGSGPEEIFESSPMTINEVDVNGFHRVSECMDDNTSIIHNTLFYQGNITALGVRLLIADNTHFSPSDEASYEIKQINTSTIELFWKVPPDSPVEFDYVLSRMGEISDDAHIKTQLFYRMDDGAQSLKNLYPDPIIFPQCEQFTIIANASEGGSISPEGIITVNRGDSQSFEMNTSEGFKFYGWMVDGEIKFNSPLKEYAFHNIRSNHRITAMFKPIEYQIDIFTGDNGSLISSTGSDTVLHGHNITFTIKPDTGYEIERILQNDINIEIPQDGKITFTNVIDNQQKLSITFKQKEYEIKIITNENGKVTTPGGSNLVPHGENKTFTFTPYENYVVGEVLINAEAITTINNFYTFRNVTRNYTLTVFFVAPETYTIKTNIVGDGKITPPGNIEVERGESKTFIFSPGSDSIIDDIIVDGISYGPLQTYVFTFVSQPHEITAKFTNKPTFTITASVNDENNPCGTIEPSGDVTVTQGNNQTFHIIPSGTCTIQDVLVDNESKGKIHVYTFWNVQNDHMIKAFFETEYTEHNVIVTHSEGGTVQPSGTFMVRDGGIITIKPKPDNGFQIENVIANNELIFSPYEITIDKKTMIHIDFKPYIVKPESHFKFTQLSLVDPLSVSFEDQSIGKINQWQWNFGDGYKSKAQNVTHDYFAPGTYSVTLTVSGPGGSDSNQQMIQVVKETKDPIEVRFLSTNTTGPVPFDAQFFNLTQDNENFVQSWLWDFGDGNTSDSNEKIVSHVYTKAGIYTVMLTANTADASYTSQKQNYIRIDGRKVQGRITAGNINGEDTNDPFEGCSVEVYIRTNAAQSPQFLANALTNENGEYSITGLPATDNIIVAAWPPLDNKRYIGEYYKNKSNAFAAKRLSTKMDDLEIDFVLAKVPQIGIKGQVTQNGKGQAGVEVTAFSMSKFYFQTTVSDPNGFYTFTHLKDAKDYRIYSWSENHHSDVYYFLPDDKEVGMDIPTSSVLSWDLARTVRPQDGYINNINIMIDTNNIGNISGIVRLKENGRPIKNIWVNAWSDGLKTGDGAMTDQYGAYTIIGLSVPEKIEDGYIVEIDSSDDIYPYQAYNKTDNRNSADKVIPDADLINFYLKSGNTLFGHVYRKDGEPLKKVKVTTWSLSKGTSNDTTTDETGLYSIPNLPPAIDYVVSAFSDDYPIQYFFHKNKQKNADLVDLTKGDVYNIDFHLDEGATIEGTVTIQNDQNESLPAEDIFVNAWSENDERLYTEKTDKDGKYRFIGLNANASDYNIYVWDEDYLRAIYSDTGTVHYWEQATGVTPGTFNEPAKCDILLSKGFSIQGLIKADGKPIADVKVEAWNSSNEFFADDVSTDGLSQAYNYKLTGLPGNETYEIHFKHDEYKDESIILTISNDNIDNANCELELPSRSISGYLRHLEFDKMVFVKVQRKNSTDIRMQKIVGTDPTPPYEVPYIFTGLKPGSNYMVDIIPTSDYPYVSYKNIDITNDNQENIDLELITDTRTLQGTITFPENVNMDDTVWIYAWSEKSTESEQLAKVIYKENKIVPYKIEGLTPAKDYIVSLESKVYEQQYYDNAVSYQHAKKVDLTQDQNNIDFVLKKGASITGSVYDADGSALSGIRVEAWSDSTNHLGFTKTDTDGNYEIGGLKLVNDYLVYIQYQQSVFYYHTDGIVSKINKATHVSTHQLAKEIDFHLIETGIISGVVRDSNNKRLENVMVTAQSASTGANNGSITDKRGRYVIKGLPVEDDYQVTATPPSGSNYKAQLQSDISTGATHVDFSLMSGFTIAGIVKNWSGTPVVNAKVEISSKDPIQPQPCFTGENGAFLIAGIPDGDYYFQVMAPDNSQLIDYLEKAFVIDNNILGKIVTLRPASQIDGTVTLAGSINNAPLSDIMVTIFSESHSFWTYAITDQDGYYQFDSIPDATDYVIKNISDNYQSHLEINRASGETVNFALEAAVVLNGLLINAQNGSGIENALIEVRYQGELRDETRTDSNGKFIASSLPSIINGTNAEYVVVAKYAGFPDVQARWATNQTDLFVLTMSRGDQNIIKGVVTDKNGDIPTIGVNVTVRYYIEQERKGYLGSVNCAADGSFTIKGLSPNQTYHLKFISKYLNEKKKFWLGSNNEPVSKRIHAGAVTPGQDTISFQFENAWNE